jgi:hypothetical protein
MDVRPQGTSLVFLKEQVVEVAKDGLEEEEYEDDDADDGMVLVELCWVRIGKVMFAMPNLPGPVQMRYTRLDQTL